jgi:hypothetical protein
MRSGGILNTNPRKEQSDVKEYHKIDSLFKRDMEARGKPLIVGDWANDVFAYLANNEWEFTEKVDGTNIRVIVRDGQIEFGGKTDNAAIPAPLVKRLQERFLPQREMLLAIFPDDGCLYGEGYGAKIQSGGNYRPDQDIVIFDVCVGEWWLQRPAVEDVATRVEAPFTTPFRRRLTDSTQHGGASAQRGS